MDDIQTEVAIGGIYSLKLEYFKGKSAKSSVKHSFNSNYPT